MNTAELKDQLHDVASYLIGRLAQTGTPSMSEAEVVHACWSALGYETSLHSVNGLLALCASREMQTLIVFLDQWIDALDGGDE